MKSFMLYLLSQPGTLGWDSFDEAENNLSHYSSRAMNINLSIFLTKGAVPVSLLRTKICFKAGSLHEYRPYRKHQLLWQLLLRYYTIKIGWIKSVRVVVKSQCSAQWNGDAVALLCLPPPPPPALPVPGGHTHPSNVFSERMMRSH